MSNRSLLICILSGTIWLVGFCWNWCFESFRFVIDCVVEALLYTEAKLGGNAPCQDKLISTKEVRTFYSWKPFSDVKTRTSLPCFQVVVFRNHIRISIRTFATWCLFMLCRFHSSILTFAKKPDHFIWTRLKELVFALARKQLEHLEKKEMLCVHRPKALNVSTALRQTKLWRNGSAVCTIT